MESIEESRLRRSRCDRGGNSLGRAQWACETESQAQMRQLNLMICFVGGRKRWCIPAKGGSMLKF
jgi:hypothetical protein